MEIPRKAKINLFIGFFITVLMAVFMCIELSPMEIFEEKLYDYRFIIRGTIQPPEDIVIAAIDEKSLRSLGRWPWSRDKFARLVKRLTEEEAEIVVVDIKFEDWVKRVEDIANPPQITLRGEYKAKSKSDHWLWAAGRML